MSGSWSLSRAKRRRRDEFYTRLSDVAAEVACYPDGFRDKVVLCPADDFRVSAFFRFFLEGFGSLGLSGLLASAFSRRHGDLLERGGPGFWAEVCESGVDVSDVEARLFRGDGDFRGSEVAVLLERSDVVVTNPPFSLFREFMSWLEGKEFLVLGPPVALGYEVVFDLIREGRLWTGVCNGGKWFSVDDNYDVEASQGVRMVDGVRFVSAPAFWFTNLEHGRRPALDLSAAFDPGGLHKRYDNFDAFNVDRLRDVPADFEGRLGVPLTFLQFYDPLVWRLVGLDKRLCRDRQFRVDGRAKFSRVVVERR